MQQNKIRKNKLTEIVNKSKKTSNRSKSCYQKKEKKEKNKRISNHPQPQVPHLIHDNFVFTAPIK